MMAACENSGFLMGAVAARRVPTRLQNLRWSRLRWLGLVVCLALLSACSSVQPWTNTPMKSNQLSAARINWTRDPSMVVAVTISGGGARAAAFGYGILRALDEVQFDWNGKDLTLLDATDLVSGVSGGAIVAAYYAAFGREELPRFEAEFLRRDFQHELVSMILSPGNMYRLTSPWFGRSHLLQEELDALYRGMTYGDLERRPRHPQLFVTATELTRGHGFEFTWDQFALICSDLDSVPLSFAVAASSAVPVALSPIAVRNFANQCPPEVTASVMRAANVAPDGLANYRQRIYRARMSQYLDSNARPFIHLVDGGLSDNLGVQRLLDRALMSGGLRQTFRQVPIATGSVRKVVLVVINAGRDPTRDLDLSDEVPGIFDVAETLLFGTGARDANETQEYLRDVARTWHREIEARGGELSTDTDVFARGAEIHVIMVNLRDAPVKQRRTLLRVPTAFTISDHETSELIAAGRQILHASPDFQVLVRALDARIVPADSDAGAAPQPD